MDRFPTTRHSIVLAATGDDDGARAALDSLCRLYWPPLYAFIRRRGHDEETARDLTQAFIVRLLEKGTLRQFERLGTLAARKPLACSRAADD